MYVNMRLEEEEEVVADVVIYLFMYFVLIIIFQVILTILRISLGRMQNKDCNSVFEYEYCKSIVVFYLFIYCLQKLQYMSILFTCIDI